jgi:dopamine beta-monooxygenase
VIVSRFLGRSGVISLLSNGKTIKVLDNVTSYDYNTPTMTELDTPFELKPGYEIEVKCVYDSTKRTTTTKYGEATSDEMCFGFIAYYPLVENLGFCGQMDSLPICPTKIGVGPCEISKIRELIQKFPLLYRLLFQ